MNQSAFLFFNRLQRAGWLVGFVGLLACAGGAVVDTRQFFISWLYAWTFWLGLALGCFGTAMIHHLTGGRWGFVVRRILEAGFLTLPLMAALFVPLVFGLRVLYPWASPENVAASEILQQKHLYLNVPGFLTRAVLYFALWIFMASRLRKWSLQQDTASDPAPTIRLRTLSGPGVVLYALSGTFAMLDWVMSIDPEWYSTIFLVIILIGQILSAVAFGTVVLERVYRDPPFDRVVERRHFHDLGNLLLTFVMFWTYIAFSQVLIIYSGNLPLEIEWYLQRIEGSWKWVVWMLFLLHFLVPFFLLLFRPLKQHARRLAILAGALLGMHVVAVFWLIAPSFHPDGFSFHWIDAAGFAAIGGLWLARFAAVLPQAPLLPQNDPRIGYSVTPLVHAKET